MQDEKRFYVYVHKLKETGEIRYVGKGTGPRFEMKSNRSKEHLEEWDTLEKVVLIDSLTNKESRELEEKLIVQYLEEGTKLLNKVKSSFNPLELNYDFISQILYYDESSPTCLRWKVNCGNNRVKANSVAGCKNKRGYYLVKIGNHKYSSHRLVYLLCRGNFDNELLVDHINGEISDNRISNLRLVSHRENSCNQKSSQEPQWHSQRESWIATWTESKDGKITRRSKAFNPRVGIYKALDYPQAIEAAKEDAYIFQNQMRHLHYKTFNARTE